MTDDTQLRALAREMGLPDDDPQVLEDLRRTIEGTTDRPVAVHEPAPAIASTLYEGEHSSASPSAALWVSLAAGGAIIVGSLGPWSNTLGEMAPGTEWDGTITLALGALALLLVWYAWSYKSGKAAVTCFILGALVFLVGALDWINISDTSELADRLVKDQDLFGALEVRANESDLRSVAWGLYVMQLGAVSLSIGAILLRRDVLARKSV